jgi:hypothetical protein
MAPALCGFVPAVLFPFNAIFNFRIILPLPIIPCQAFFPEISEQFFAILLRNFDAIDKAHQLPL